MSAIRHPLPKTQRFQAYSPRDFFTSRVTSIIIKTDYSSRQRFVLWRDIQIVFPHAEYVLNSDDIVGFMKDDDLNEVQPLRIACHPEVILRVVVPTPTEPLNVDEFLSQEIEDISESTMTVPFDATPTFITQTNDHAALLCESSELSSNPHGNGQQTRSPASILRRRRPLIARNSVGSIQSGIVPWPSLDDYDPVLLIPDTIVAPIPGTIVIPAVPLDDVDSHFLMPEITNATDFQVTTLITQTNDRAAPLYESSELSSIPHDLGQQTLPPASILRRRQSVVSSHGVNFAEPGQYLDPTSPSMSSSPVGFDSLITEPSMSNIHAAPNQELEMDGDCSIDGGQLPEEIHEVEPLNEAYLDSILSQEVDDIKQLIHQEQLQADERLVQHRKKYLELQRTLQAIQEGKFDSERLALLSVIDMRRRITTILDRTYEPQEDPKPRLFIVLPTRSTASNTLETDPSTKFRLYFLCECAADINLEYYDFSQGIHLVKHEGYDIKNPDEFFQKYGSHVLTMLQMVKHGFIDATATVPALAHFKQVEGINSIEKILDITQVTIGSLVDNSIAFVKDRVHNITNRISVLVGSMDLENQESLVEADLRRLESYLEVDESSRVLSNLFRIINSDGHVKWVCGDHSGNPAVNKAMVMQLELHVDSTKEPISRPSALTSDIGEAESYRDHKQELLRSQQPIGPNGETLMDLEISGNGDSSIHPQISIAIEETVSSITDLEDMPSHASTDYVPPLLVEAEDKEDRILALQKKILVMQEHRIVTLQEELLALQRVAIGESDKIIALQLEATEKDEKIAALQNQILALQLEAKLKGDRTISGIESDSASLPIHSIDNAPEVQPSSFVHNQPYENESQTAYIKAFVDVPLHTMPPANMTNKSEDLRGLVLAHDDTVSTSKSIREEVSVDELLSIFNSTHLDNAPNVTLLSRLKSNAKLHEWPAEKGHESWFDRGHKFRMKPSTLEERQTQYAFTRPKVSQDIVVGRRVGLLHGSPLIAEHVLFSGKEFDDLTSNYGPSVKALIRNEIKDYFEFLHFTQDKRLAGVQNHGQKMRIKGQYMRVLRKGSVYLTTATPTQEIIARIEDEDERKATAESILVKIGYTINIENRLKDYFWDAKHGCCIKIPDFGNRPSVCFPTLLGSILHQVFVFHQVDIPCHCRTPTSKHIEIFRFDRLAGESYDDALSETMKIVKAQIDRWEKAFSKLTELHEVINELHNDPSALYQEIDVESSPKSNDPMNLEDLIEQINI